MKLVVGFLTYNKSSAKYLKDFLPSLEMALNFLAVDNYQIYVFDNSPLDNSTNRFILEDWNQGFSKSSPPRRPLKYLSVGKNLGFSRAYNILLNLAIKVGAEYFLIINPDTILDSKAISELVKVLDAQTNLASVAPKILRWDFVNNIKTKFIDSLGLIKRPGLQFADLSQGEKDNDKLYKTEIIGPSGAAGLFRLSILVKIAEPVAIGQSRHYFDERFFMYKEDCDLAYRLFLAGYKSALVPSAVIYHDRTAVSLNSSLWSKIINRCQKNKQIRSWSFKNQHIIFIKYWKNQNILNQILIILYFLSMLLFALILEQFNLKQYYYIWQDFK